MGAPPSPSETRTDRTYHRVRTTRKVAAAALIALAGAVVARRWRPIRVEIVGGSMRPTLEPGEWAVAIRTRSPRRGDIVVLEHPDRVGLELVKRVVAVAGDLAPDGRVVRDGGIWVEGVARDASTDSRSFGAVDPATVTARVVAVYHPPRRARVVRRRAVVQPLEAMSARRPVDPP